MKLLTHASSLDGVSHTTYRFIPLRLRALIEVKYAFFLVRTTTLKRTKIIS